MKGISIIVIAASLVLPIGTAMPAVGSSAATAAPISALAWAPSDPVVVAGSEDGKLTWWEVRRSTQPKVSVDAHDNAVSSLAFAPDGSTVASGGFDRRIRTWDARTGAARLTWAVERGGHAKGLAFSPDGALLAGATDRGVQLWDAARGVLIRAIPSSRGVLHTAFSPDGRTLATAGGAGVAIVDVDSGRIVRSFSGPTTELTLVVGFSPDGRLVAAGGTGKTLRVWEAAPGRLTASVSGGGDFIRVLRFRADASTLTVADRTEVRVLSLASNRSTLEVKSDVKFAAVAVSADGLMWAGGTQSGELQVSRIASTRPGLSR